MRLLYRLIVSIAYCGIFVCCQRGSSSGIKIKPGVGGTGSGKYFPAIFKSYTLRFSIFLTAGFGNAGSNSNSRGCKGGPCRNTEVIVLGTFGGLGGLMTCLTMICYCYKRHIRRVIHRNTILHETTKKSSIKYTPFDINVFKSGTWSARYLQFGVWSEPKCVSLSFNYDSCKINGSGADDIGTYTIDGSYSKGDGRMVLVKRYQLGTGDPEGNLGHRVFIRLLWNPETCQFEGPWYIRTKSYCGMDRFELRFNDEKKIWTTSTPH
jgi:hypothetical protein